MAEGRALRRELVPFAGHQTDDPPRLFRYRQDTDTLVTVLRKGYFDDASFLLKSHDLLYCVVRAADAPDETELAVLEVVAVDDGVIVREHYRRVVQDQLARSAQRAQFTPALDKKPKVA